MNKFQSLINKTIVLSVNGVMFSAFSIVVINGTDMVSVRYGKMYECEVKYYFNAPPLPHSNWFLGEKTLNELINNGTSINPEFPSQTLSIETPN